MGDQAGVRTEVHAVWEFKQKDTSGSNRIEVRERVSCLIWFRDARQRCPQTDPGSATQPSTGAEPKGEQR